MIQKILPAALTKFQAIWVSETHVVSETQAFKYKTYVPYAVFLWFQTYFYWNQQKIKLITMVWWGTTRKVKLDVVSNDFSPCMRRKKGFWLNYWGLSEIFTAFADVRLIIWF